MLNWSPHPQGLPPSSVPRRPHAGEVTGASSDLENAVACEHARFDPEHPTYPFDVRDPAPVTPWLWLVSYSARNIVWWVPGQSGIGKISKRPPVAHHLARGPSRSRLLMRVLWRVTSAYHLATGITWPAP